MDSQVRSYSSCYVCGYPNSASHPLRIQYPGKTGTPFFPFLENHEPPDGAQCPSKNGEVIACFTCFALLTEQWKLYEKNRVPLIKRLYWLKRVDGGSYAGVEVDSQSEYASQVLGLPTELILKSNKKSRNDLLLWKDSNAILPTDDRSNDSITFARKFGKSRCQSVRKLEIQEEALDLSVEGPKKKVRCKSIANEVLDLSMPDKDASTEVCYLCGDRFEKGTLTHLYAKVVKIQLPYFPDLMLHPRPSGSRPIEPSGKVLCCLNCSSYLISQWKNYENLSVPHNMRRYSFTSLLEKTESLKKICCNCGSKHNSRMTQIIMIFKNEKIRYCDLKSVSEFSMTKLGASLIKVNVCSDCYVSLDFVSITDQNNSRKSFPVKREQNSTYQSNHQLSDREMQRNTSPSQIELDNVSCCLCHRSYLLKSMQTLLMKPDPSIPNTMYFPFLKFLPYVNQNMITEDGRVLACKPCYTHLTLQWMHYEKGSVHPSERHYNLRSLSAGSYSSKDNSLETSPQSSPECSNPASPLLSPNENLSKTARKDFIDNCTSKDKIDCNNRNSHVDLENIPENRHNDIENKKTTGSSDKIIALPYVVKEKGLHLKTKCVLCSFSTKPGHTYAVTSNPVKPMYFPFLQKLSPQNSEPDDHFLLCLFCYHSLISQWSRYEQEKVKMSMRIYNTYTFTCFVCSTKTFRRRLCLLPVKDYPFLKDHKSPKGGMVVNNGRSVIVCKDCFISLNEQYTALEKLGVPVDKKQYNWIQRPPPAPEVLHHYDCCRRDVFNGNSCSTSKSHYALRVGRSRAQSLCSLRNCTGGICHCPKNLRSCPVEGTWRSPVATDDDEEEKELEESGIKHPSLQRVRLSPSSVEC